MTIISFKKFLILDESFYNYLHKDIDKKKEIVEEVFEMIQRAYASQGGIHGSGFNSPEDMILNIPFWKVSKQNGKIKAAALYKDTNGRKRVAIATDGTPEGKKAATEIVINDLKQDRAYMELSGKSLSFLKKLIDLKPYLFSFEKASEFHKSRNDQISRPQPDDLEVKRHPDLKEFMYSRSIGGHLHTKVMLGTMGKQIE